MNAIEIGIVVFVCVFGSSLAGTALRAMLPSHHLSGESKEVVKLAMGLVATMTALVLGLLVASAKGSYDTQGAELTDLSARLVLVDRVLAHYGPESKPVRDALKQVAGTLLSRMEPADASPTDLVVPTTSGELPLDLLQALEPKGEPQRALKEKALDMLLELSRERWLMVEQRASGFARPLLVIVVIWLSVIFGSFALYTTPNPTATVSLGIAALSVSAAIFLVIEMYSPYSGLIRITMAPLREAISQLGR